MMKSEDAHVMGEIRFSLFVQKYDLRLFTKSIKCENV